MALGRESFFQVASLFLNKQTLGFLRKQRVPKNNFALDISIRTTNNYLSSKVKPKSFVREMTPREKSIYNAVVPALTTTIEFTSSKNTNYA